MWLSYCFRLSLKNKDIAHSLELMRKIILGPIKEQNIQKRRNITIITKADGTITSDKEEVINEFFTFYKKIVWKRIMNRRRQQRHNRRRR